MSSTKRRLMLRIAKTVIGLAIAALGMHINVKANVGVSPWTSLYLGLCNITGLPYRAIYTAVCFATMVAAILLKERIGLSTVVDVCMVGQLVDLYDWLGFVPAPTGLVSGIALMLVGLLIMTIGQCIYMSAGTCCGPQEALLVGLGKLVRRVPIGAVTMGLQVFLVTCGWLLGGPIGIGTLISMFGLGVIMQLVCRVSRFEPRDVVHEDLRTFLRALFARTN